MDDELVLPLEFTNSYLHEQAERHAVELTNIWNERAVSAYRRTVANWVKNYFENGSLVPLPIPPLVQEFWVNQPDGETRAWGSSAFAG